MKSLAEIVIKQQFLEQIEAIFRDCEEKNDEKSIEILANIVEIISKNPFEFSQFLIFYLKKPFISVKSGSETVFTTLTNDRNFQWVFGVLECNLLKNPVKNHHFYL